MKEEIMIRINSKVSSAHKINMQGIPMPSRSNISFKKLYLFMVLCLLTIVVTTGTVKAQGASNPYLGQIMIVAFDFDPRGWHECDGSILPIAQNQALFSLLGTTYGGDGRTTFALPDLRGRVPVHANGVIRLGQKGGAEQHALSIAQIPPHTHNFNVASLLGTILNPTAHPARAGDLSRMYGKATNSVMNTAAVGLTGIGTPHENRMPYQTLRYIIALQGTFPSRN
jgi:microcystin-dependent protein